MIDADEVNLQNNETWQYIVWEQEMKNHILSIANGDRKKELWNKYFPQAQTPDDSYLEGLVF